MATIYQNGIQYSGSGEPLIYDDMGGATSTTGGVHGLVPAPSAGDNEKFLSGDGSWKSAGEYVTKEASGNPIEISDGASAPLVKCVTQITGSQDLHGSDKPWVGGAGKNILDFRTKATGGDAGVTYSNNNGIISVNGVSSGYSYYQSPSQSFPAGTYIVSGRPSNTVSQLSLYWADSSTSMLTVPAGQESTFTLTETTNIFARVIVVGTADHETISPMIRKSSESDSSWIPYENICPITAYTEGKIEVRGKNLFDKNASGNVANRYLDASNGNLKVSSSGWGTSDYIPVKENTTYATNVVPFIGSGQSAEICAYDESKVFISGVSNRLGNYTTPPNTAFIRIDYAGSAIDNIQLELGSTATAYEPYTSTTHTTTYPSAIYRGSEDVVNGTEAHDMVVVDLGDYDWTIQSIDGNTCFRTTLDNKSFTSNAICSQYSFSNRCEEDGTFSTVIGSANHLFVRDSRYSTTARFKTGVTGVKLAYQLATPTTSSVTPTNLPVKSLNGYNHIESSTGEMEVEYITEAFSPITELVDSQISALQKMMELILTSAREVTMTASANYTTGTLIVACGALYKATTAISSGASLVVGTNITPTTIAAELAALA